MSRLHSILPDISIIPGLFNRYQALIWNNPLEVPGEHVSRLMEGCFIMEILLKYYLVKLGGRYSKNRNLHAFNYQISTRDSTFESEVELVYKDCLTYLPYFYREAETYRKLLSYLGDDYFKAVRYYWQEPDKFELLDGDLLYPAVISLIKVILADSMELTVVSTEKYHTQFLSIEDMARSSKNSPTQRGMKVYNLSFLPIIASTGR